MASYTSKISRPRGFECYQTLGVSPYADSKALASAFRRVALQIHPDKNNSSQEAKERFQEVNSFPDYLALDHFTETRLYAAEGNLRLSERFRLSERV